VISIDFHDFSILVACIMLYPVLFCGTPSDSWVEIQDLNQTDGLNLELTINHHPMAP
jgi:hypothetical protein